MSALLWRYALSGSCREHSMLSPFHHCLAILPCNLCFLQDNAGGSEDLMLPQSRTLSFCAEHESCTCCTGQQARRILRSIISGLRDPLLSARCRDWTTRMACRPCDVDIGTGLKSGVCQQACNEWFASCKDDFMEETQLSGHIRPCSEEATVCSKVSELATNGTSLCKAHGLEVASGDQSCFNGQPSEHRFASCQRPSRKGSSSSISSLDSLIQNPVSVVLLALMLILAALCWRQLKPRSRPRLQSIESLAVCKETGPPVLISEQRAVNLSHSRLTK